MGEEKPVAISGWGKTVLLGAVVGFVLVLLTWVLFPSLFKQEQPDPATACVAKCDAAGRAYDSFRRVGNAVTCYCEGDMLYYVPDRNLSVPNWSVGL